MNNTISPKFSRGFLIGALAAICYLLGNNSVWSHPGCGGPPSSSSAPRTNRNTFGQMFAQSQPMSEAGMTKKPMKAPHGGQISATDFHYFEVVYLPHEIRVFLYGPSQYRYNARGVTGTVVCRVKGNAQEFRYPLQVRTERTWSGDKGYLVAAVDVTRVRDEDMEVSFDIENLHRSDEETARFSQIFRLTQRPIVEVRQALYSESDRTEMEQQRTCPVHRHPLGDRQPPVKMIVNGQTVFACRGACATAVRDKPGHYVDSIEPDPAPRMSSRLDRPNLRRLPRCN